MYLSNIAGIGIELGITRSWLLALKVDLKHK